MSATGGFTPPEPPGGPGRGAESGFDQSRPGPDPAGAGSGLEEQTAGSRHGGGHGHGGGGHGHGGGHAAGSGPEGQAPRGGLSVGPALGILAGVVALGLIAVFAVGHLRSGGTTLVAHPGVTSTASARVSAGASGEGTPSSAPTRTASATGTSGAGSGGGMAPVGTAFTVGECVDTSGSGADFDVEKTSCASADYKIIHAFQNQSGHVSDDEGQCYRINGDDNEFENGDPTDGYTLYCMNSLIGDYSPRRAQVDNCLDAKAEYEVDCSGPRAAWIVIGRLNDTTDTKSCSQFGSYDTSYFWTATPPFVLCVDKYSH